MTSLHRIIQKIKSDPTYSPKNTFAWFKGHVANLQLDSTKTYTNNATFTKLLPGQVYLFNYDPKTKDTLPYYDRFPLVIPWNKDEKGFIGLNIHYLPGAKRLVLLDKLNQFAITTKNKEKALMLQWGLIENVSKFPEVQVCVKRYLFSHVRSKFLRVPSEDWMVMSALPTEVFIGAKSSEVWHDSVQRMRK